MPRYSVGLAEAEDREECFLPVGTGEEGVRLPSGPRRLFDSRGRVQLDEVAVGLVENECDAAGVGELEEGLDELRRIGRAGWIVWCPAQSAVRSAMGGCAEGS